MCWFQLNGKRSRATNSLRQWSAFALWTYWQQPDAKNTARTEKSLTLNVPPWALSWAVNVIFVFLMKNWWFRLLLWAHHANLPISLNILNYLYGFSMYCQYNMVLGFASNICWACLVFTFCIATATSQGTVSLSPGAGKGVLVLVWSCSQLDQPTDPAEKQSAIFLGQVFNQISLLTSLMA